MVDLKKLCDIAIDAAQAAGTIISQHMDHDIEVHEKKAGTSRASQVITEVDRKCEKAIIDILTPSCEKYDLALLSEETEDDGSRFIKEYFWCIDPMDGTLAFINKRPGYSVSIALVAKDGTPHIGVVLDPSTAHHYHAIKGMGAYKNHHPWTITSKNNLLTYVTDKRLADTPKKDQIESMLERIKSQHNLDGIKEIHGGGAVLNAIQVLENNPAVMIKLPKKEEGGGCIWDYAATACIFHELGRQASSYHGDKLDLNKKDGAFMNVVGVYFENI